MERDVWPAPQPTDWCGEWKAKPVIRPREPRQPRTLAERILATIRKAGTAGATTTQINSSHSKNASAAERRQALADLEAAGKIRILRDALSRMTWYTAIE